MPKKPVAKKPPVGRPARPKRAAPAGARKPAAGRQVDFAAIGRVAKVASIHDVFTAAFSAEAAPSGMNLQEEDLAVRVRYRAERVDAGSNELLIARVELGLEIGYQDEKVAQLETVLMLAYEIGEGEFSADDLELFARINGVYNAWPYLREAVDSHLGRLRLPRLALPVWRPPKELPPKGKFTILERNVAKG